MEISIKKWNESIKLKFNNDMRAVAVHVAHNVPTIVFKNLPNIFRQISLIFLRGVVR